MESAQIELHQRLFFPHEFYFSMKEVNYCPQSLKQSELHEL